MSRRGATPAPQPLLLGAAGHTCVAWWHAPAAAPGTAWPGGGLPAEPLAVVLASSWGDEDMASYDALRLLACRLAGCGLGTLRFEWPDTGDSSAATGAASIADLLGAFDAAAAQALALSGCERLAFVGLRLGALLAAHAAVARADVDALVALMPVADGRAFVQAQSLLGAGVARPLPDMIPGGAFDAAELPQMLGGFTQSLRHVEALSVLKWPSAATTSVLEALLLWSPDAPGRAASDALARMGVRVHDSVHGELAAMPALGRVDDLPAAAIAEIVRWLQERAADASVTQGVARIEDFGVADASNASVHAAAAAARLAAATSAVLALAAGDAPVWMRLLSGGVAVRERVVQIAAADDSQAPLLTGVLSERDLGRPAAADRSAVLLLSSGRERRIGPHRLWVPWARRRAALGDVVLRLDGAGIGDSAARESFAEQRVHYPYGDRATEEVARAVAWLRREHGVRTCTVIGLHSGAFQAWRAALAGVCVHRVVAIDMPVLHRPPDVALTPAARPSGPFAATLAARLGRALRQRARGVARALGWPRGTDLGAELALASRRGIAVDFVFSAREPGLALLRAQAGRRGGWLLRAGFVKTHEIPHGDARFAGAAGRAELLALLDALLAPAPSPAACAIVGSSRQPAIARS
jgi:hypothetical protein